MNKGEAYREFLLSRYAGTGFNMVKRVEGRVKTKFDADLVFEYLELFSRAGLVGMHERGKWATEKGPRTFWRVSFYLAWRKRDVSHA